jgi:hypothetical protein
MMANPKQLHSQMMMTNPNQLQYSKQRLHLRAIVHPEQLHLHLQVMSYPQQLNPKHLHSHLQVMVNQSSNCVCK